MVTLVVCTTDARMSPLTCGDHTEFELTNRAVDVGRILHLADVSAVVGELDLANYNGRILAHDVSGPIDPLPEDAVRLRIGFVLVVEYLRVEEEI